MQIIISNRQKLPKTYNFIREDLPKVFIFEDDDVYSAYFMEEGVKLTKFDKNSIISKCVRVNESDKKQKIVDSILSKIIILNPDEVNVVKAVESFYEELSDVYEANKNALDECLDGKNNWFFQVKLKGKDKVLTELSFQEFMSKKRSSVKKHEQSVSKNDDNEDEDTEPGEIKEKTVAEDSAIVSKFSVSIENTEEDVDIDMNVETVEEISELIHHVENSLKYAGFSPSDVRKKFATNYSNSVSCARDLCVVFSAYTNVGNRVSKIDSKRSNMGISKKVKQLIVKLKIVQKTDKKDGLTLPRLAISFMPAYLIYRKFISSKVPYYEDLCFFGCESIREIDGYSEYHRKFSRLIYKGGKATKGDEKTESEFESDYKRWKSIIITGYDQDTSIHRTMKEALKTKDLNSVEAFNEIVSIIEKII
jgi:hypothetical protein